LFRDAEKQYMSALKQHVNIDIYLYLTKIYIKLDQPLNAISKLKEANEKFAYETSVLQGIARIYEVSIFFLWQKRHCQFHSNRMKFWKKDIFFNQF
jgi:hypothetical protein